jgi:hypothetical protein
VVDVGQEAPKFSIVLGGPFYRLLLRARLAREPLHLLPRRSVVIAALAWLPLLLLSLADGRAIAGVQLPLLSDLETYVRFLLALPLLLYAENLADRRLPEVIEQFRERGIVSLASERFDEAVLRANRRAHSTVAELVMLALALIVGPWLWRNGLALQSATWYADPGEAGPVLRPAGWWFVHVSGPIFQFLLLRWYYRLAVWWLFLWDTSRLPLRLLAMHPDRAGGIGFLGEASTSFMVVLFAQAAMLSGLIASRVLFEGASAVDYRGHVLLFIVLLVATVIVPLFFFCQDIARAQREGLRRYGLLATALARDFERKWLGAQLPADEALLGNPDPSSLADLAGAGDIVREMRLVPFGLSSLLLLVGAAALPFLPLVLTVIPLTELLRDAVEMLL